MYVRYRDSGRDESPAFRAFSLNEADIAYSPIAGASGWANRRQSQARSFSDDEAVRRYSDRSDPSLDLRDEAVGIQAIPTLHGMTATIYFGMPNQSQYFVLQANGRWRITVTSGDDVIAGTATGDDMRGEGGNDTICGFDGDDDMHGGYGDELHARRLGATTSSKAPSGTTSSRATSGNDVVAGNAGDDFVYGGWTTTPSSVGPGSDLNGGGQAPIPAEVRRGGAWQNCDVVPVIRGNGVR